MNKTTRMKQLKQDRLVKVIKIYSRRNLSDLRKSPRRNISLMKMNL